MFQTLLAGHKHEPFTHDLGAGQATQLEPNNPAEQTQLEPFHVLLAGQIHELLTHDLGAGQATQSEPNVPAGQRQSDPDQVLLFGHAHFPSITCLGCEQQSQIWSSVFQTYPGSQATHFWVTGFQYLGALHLTQNYPATK